MKNGFQLSYLARNGRRLTTHWSKFARLSLITLFFVIVIIILAEFNLSDFQALIDRNRNLVSLVSLLVIILMSLALIPTIPITLFISVLLGPLPATLITTLGTTITAFVHYQIGRKIGDVVNFEENKARLPLKLGNLPVNSTLFLLIGRIIPGGPVGLSFVCGAYSVPYFPYFWTTFITNLFGSALVALGGDVLVKL